MDRRCAAIEILDCWPEPFNIVRNERNVDLKVLAGENKGRKLYAPKSNAIRPSLARVRKSIFDILGEKIRGSQVLDLFAGAGTLGIESLSRGADFALFVDNSRESINLIKKNVGICGYQKRSQIFMCNIPDELKRIERGGFDTVFIDAPYERDMSGPTLITLSSLKILKESCVIIARVSRREELLDQYDQIVLQTMRSYGDSKLYFYDYKR